MSEHDEQVAVVEWCDLNGIPVFAIPNGGMRCKRTAALLKAEEPKTEDGAAHVKSHALEV